MQLLESLVLSGKIIDIAVGVMLIELFVLIAMQRLGKLVLDIRGAVYNLGAGGSLALGIKAALNDSGVVAIAACLLCSLAFHSLDTFRRVRRSAA